MFVSTFDHPSVGAGWITARAPNSSLGGEVRKRLRMFTRSPAITLLRNRAPAISPARTISPALTTPRGPFPPRRRFVVDDDGSATAEYAIATLAAVGFAGLLVVILRSGEVRGMLTDLIHRALTFAG